MSSAAIGFSVRIPLLHIFGFQSTAWRFTKILNHGCRQIFASSTRGRQGLNTIDLRGTKITDAGLKELQSHHNLKEVNLCLVPGGPFDVTRDGIKELQAALSGANILR